MSLEKAKGFVEILKVDPELQKKLSGFTLDELKQVMDDMKKSGELSDTDLDNVAGGVSVFGYGFDF